MEWKTETIKGSQSLLNFQKRDETEHETVEYAQLLFQD